MAEPPLRLKVLLPTEILVDEPVQRVLAEAENGWFCLLPRHVDFAAALVPGVLCFQPTAGTERYAALDAAILLKCGREVLVSAQRGVRGEALESLEALVRERFLELDEQARRARAALARLEASTLRRFRDLQGHGRG
ncbi:MAG: F0F1 ATP synthase subunit epsilon [Pseudomonadales bacterium]|jgi:F-type H+-transporting ATPase subunit epsilon|nr:F0F1 ATP synthase subunit epsilon [Pseudomonadales bacterium]